LRQALTDLILQRIKLAGDLNPEGEIRQQEMDSFFYSAAHDLREPLIGIRSYLQLIQMEDGQSLSDRNVKRMDSLVELTYRMEETLKSLMWFTNTGKNVMDIKPHDMGELVREVAGMVMLAYPKLDLRIEIQADFPETHCDEVKVKAIYQNLIRNAAKYNDHTARRIEIGYYLNHAIPVFFVRDNGIGIATEHHADIFELFRRLHGSEAYGGGSGAGLTIVRKAVERHGGRIWLDSTPSQGTTFFFTLTPSSTQDRPS
jgi:chemotaxis family two-component system sensor kinase Cph1